VPLDERYDNCSSSRSLRAIAEATSRQLLEAELKGVSMEQQEATEGQSGTSVSRAVSELGDQVTDRAHGLAEQAQDMAESQKERLVNGAHDVAQALHHASDGLRGDHQETVGSYTEALAEQVEKIAQFLQSRDLPTMAREVSGFARRQPALFLGGAFTLGIVAARFLKSSDRKLGQEVSGG